MSPVADTAQGAPLLEVRKLTLRFGGLTAVHEVDLRVEPGQIAAVIGPNGAGKTSLFNAITGIYEPTEGEVRLGGRDVREPLSRRHVVRWAAAGLLLGTLALLAAANVDALWAAVVKQRPPADFTPRQAVADAWSYLRAEPRVEPRVGKWFVVSADGQLTFGIARALPEAEALRARVTALQEAGAQVQIGPDPADPTGFAARIGGGEALVTGRTAAEVEAKVQDAARAGETARKARWLRLLAFVGGTLLGTAAAHAVWKRTRRTPSSVARLGVARTFQNIRLFHNMTVLENVLVAMDRHLRHQVPWTHPTRLVDALVPAGLVACLLGLVIALRSVGGKPDGAVVPAVLLAVLIAGTLAWLVRIGRRGAFSTATLATEALGRGQALELLRFVGLGDKTGDLARNLAYGDQRRLEIARALATRPRLLLLDEPAAGMNPSETVALMHLIRGIRDRGVTVLLIEHHMRVVMGISDRITVLVHGKRIAEGTADEIRANPAVVEAYLGTEDTD